MHHPLEQRRRPQTIAPDLAWPGGEVGVRVMTPLVENRASGYRSGKTLIGGISYGTISPPRPGLTSPATNAWGLGKQEPGARKHQLQRTIGTSMWTRPSGSGGRRLGSGKLQLRTAGETIEPCPSSPPSTNHPAQPIRGDIDPQGYSLLGTQLVESSLYKRSCGSAALVEHSNDSQSTTVN